MERLAGLQTSLQALWLRGVAMAEERSLHRSHSFETSPPGSASLAGERAAPGGRWSSPARPRRDAAGRGRDGQRRGLEGEGRRSWCTRVVYRNQHRGRWVTARGRRPRHPGGRRRRAGTAPAWRVHRTTAAEPDHHASYGPRHGRGNLRPGRCRAARCSRCRRRSKPWPLPADLPYSQRRAKALAAIARFYVEHQTAVPSGRLGDPTSWSWWTSRRSKPGPVAPRS